MDKSILEKFKQSASNAGAAHNLLATKLLTDAITSEIEGQLPPSSLYEFTCIGYTKPMYEVIGGLKGISGGHALQFSGDLQTCGFSANIGFDAFTPSKDVKEMMEACIQKTNTQAYIIENLIVGEYTSIPRYGDLKYLEKEFTEFVNEKCDEFSQGHGVNVKEKFPFKFDYKGRLLDYLQFHKGHMENVHVIGSIKNSVS